MWIYGSLQLPLKKVNREIHWTGTSFSSKTTNDKILWLSPWELFGSICNIVRANLTNAESWWTVWFSDITVYSPLFIQL